MLRVRPAVLALAVVVALVGCTDDDSGAEVPDPSPSVSRRPPITSAELVDAGLARAPGYGTGDLDLGVVPCDTTATDRYGTFTRTCLRDDAPVLAFDATGPDRSLLAPGSQGFDEGYVRAAVAAAGRFVVQDLIDSTAQWDDSPEAWAGLDAATGALFGDSPHDVRASIGDGTTTGWSDAGDWRENQGLRPAPYEPGVPRMSFDELEVAGITMSAIDGDYRLGFSGINVQVDARYRQPVLTEDGRTWELVHWLSATISSDEATGAASGIEWRDHVTVGAEVPDVRTIAPLHGLAGAAGPVATIDDLSLTLLEGAVLAKESENEARSWKTFTLGPGRELRIDGAGSYAAPGEGVRWTAVREFENYRLLVPGAASALAEIGTDDEGRYRVRVDLDASTSDGGTRAYHVEWDSTPETALAELQQIAGSMSFSVRCPVPSRVRACARTRRSVI
ncbi:hypothetical protein [Cellulomonas sp. URHB0016]